MAKSSNKIVLKAENKNTGKRLDCINKRESNSRIILPNVAISTHVKPFTKISKASASYNGR